MNDLTLHQALMWVLAAAGGLLTVSKAWEIIWKHLHPESDLREKMVKIDKCLDNDNQRLVALEKKQAQSTEFEGVMCRVMLAQLNHELSGNEISKLKDARDELNKFLTDR